MRKVYFAYGFMNKYKKCDTIVLDLPNEPHPTLLCSLYLPSMRTRSIDFASETRGGHRMHSSVLDMPCEITQDRGVDDTVAMYKH